MDGKYFRIWFEDRQSILETMKRNMLADLEAGYDPEGRSIRKQKVNIEKFEIEFEERIDQFKNMEDGKVERWCYYDLIKRGAIS